MRPKDLCCKYRHFPQAKSFIPDQAKQSSAKYRKECVETDENGKITGIKPDPMDRLDAGNYKMNEKGDVGKIWALAAAKEAKEKGDTELAEYLDRELSESVTLKEDGKGTTFADEMSTMMAICYAMAKLTEVNYLHEAIANGPPEYTFRGPLLAEAPYQEVLVARAWSNGKDLDLVLYDGCHGRVTANLQLERLKPGMKYLCGEQTIAADEDGKAEMQATVEGWTVFDIKLVGI